MLVHSNEQRVAYEPSPRWVRVRFGGETVADTRRALLLRETGHLPVYYFPRDDVRMDLMEPTEHHTTCPYKGQASYWTLRAGDQVAENVAWSYLEPLEGREALADYVAFYWKPMDAWFEEEEQIFVHPRDPYKRIDVLRSSRHVQVLLDGETIAESDRPTLLFETGLPTRYYLPRDDVRMERLRPTDSVTQCPYKGTAGYWAVEIGGERHDDLAWCYEHPLPEAHEVKDLVCFYNERVDLIVDGEPQERPRTRWSR